MSGSFHEALDDLLECFRQFEEWLPGTLGSVMEFLVQIPEGDELEMYRLADLRLELTNLLAAYQQQVGPVGAEVMMTFLGGQDGGAAAYRQKYIRHMKVAANATESQASLTEMVRASGNSFEFMKLMALWDLFDLAMALFAAIMTLVQSFGLSTIGVGAAYAAARAGIAKAARELMQELAQHGTKAAFTKLPRAALDVGRSASPFVRTPGGAPIRRLPVHVRDLLRRTRSVPPNVWRAVRHPPPLSTLGSRALRYPGRAMTDLGTRLVRHNAGRAATRGGGLSRFADLDRIARQAPDAAAARTAAIAARQATNQAADQARREAADRFARMTGRQQAAAIAQHGAKYVFDGALQGARGALKEVGSSMAYMVAAGHQDSIVLLNDEWGRPGLLNMTAEEAITGGVGNAVTRGHDGTLINTTGEGIGALTASGVTYALDNPTSLTDWLLGDGQGLTSAGQEAAYELIGGVR
ncbi:hypothetical protein ACFF2X_43110, partial [Cryptosporangium minutisporangium]